MAYDQGYYQQPAQRPYNGRAAQRPGPPQGYAQPPPQQYPPQQYDQYPQQDGYGYDDYNGGYAQDYDGGYQDMNGGGRGNGYPPPNQNYPPQQEYYGNDRGGGGGGMPPRAGGRGGPMQRPPTADSARGGYDARGGGQGRGYPPNGGPVGRGGRPAPLDRAATSDPGTRVPRKPLKTPPMSPDQTAWDNPFPTFPGVKKKTSVSEEKDILQKMANMEVGSQPQGKGPSRNPSGGRATTTDDYGRPSMEGQRRGPPPEGYGRPSGEAPRNMPIRGPPQQGYPAPRQGPSQGPSNSGYAPRQNTYGPGGPGYDDQGGYAPGPTSPIRDNFGPPSRSMTMPNEAPMPMGRQPPMQGPMDGPGPSAPYNGPVGRGMPPRPSTASGNRPSPRGYPNQGPAPAPAPVDPYSNGNSQGYGTHRQNESVSDFYDSYYDQPQQRPQSAGSEMPNFGAAPTNPESLRRGASIEEHIRPGQNSYGQAKPMEFQPDARGQAQPQAAVFEMAGAPNGGGYAPQSYQNDGYGGQYNQGPPNQRGPPPPQQGYDDQQNGFAPPPRGASANPRAGPGFAGLPNGPKPGFNGLPNGPSPGITRAGTMPIQSSPGVEGGLPSHPPPVRAGLIPNSVAAQASNKPMPVRNYNNVSPGQQAPPPQSAAAQEPPPPPPVTVEEIEKLRDSVKINPNNQEEQMLLAKKLVEASEILVPKIPDQRARGKARERYVMDAFKLLKKLVQSQNVEAMFYLADCYGRGALGLETDNKEAFSLYQSAAKAGHAAAAYRTAVCCELGQEEGGGTRKDPLKAIQWYKRAAMLGDTPAMYKMGMIQLKGLLGQPKNPREAVGWLKRAAERADAENPHALHELGLLYEQPQGSDNSVVRDEAYSFSLFNQAADLGYKFSQFRLGCAFEYGLFGCTIDPRQSIMWYSRAAAQEEHQSELALSGWYLTGSEGVLQQSDTEAYLWARKAAMAGLAKAEYAMGYFTEVGIGAPANLEDAKRWYWRAAAQNFPKAKERLEDLKKGGSKAGLKSRERISRSKVGKQNEGGFLFK